MQVNYRVGRWLATLLALPMQWCMAQDSLHQEVFSIGSARVTIQQVTKNLGMPGVLFINLHENESTSVEAGKMVLDSMGGRLVHLVHTGTRLVSFKIKKRTYSFDPNRIFTPEGIAATLRTYKSYQPTAVKEVAKFARRLTTQYINGHQLIVALHNNTDSNYSLLSYLADTVEMRNAARVYVNPDQDPDNFFYTTDSCLYKLLEARQMNVILQNDTTVTNDGSLSVYAARQGIPYINVEAEHNQLPQQVAMLQVLAEIMEVYLKANGQQCPHVTVPAQQTDPPAPGCCAAVPAATPAQNEHKK